MDNSVEDSWIQLTDSYGELGIALLGFESKYKKVKERCTELEEDNCKQEQELNELRWKLSQSKQNSNQEEHDKQNEILNTRIAKVHLEYDKQIIILNARIANLDLELSTERKYWQTKYRIPCSTKNVSGEHGISSNLSHDHFETSHEHETLTSASSAHLVPSISNEQEFPMLTTGGHSLGTLTRENVAIQKPSDPREPKQVLLPGSIYEHSVDVCQMPKQFTEYPSTTQTSATMPIITPSQPAMLTKTLIQPDMTMLQQTHIHSTCGTSLPHSTVIPLLPRQDMNQSSHDCQIPEPPIELSATSKAIKSAIKYKSNINTRLTIDGLRQEGNKGRQLLNTYFMEVEKYCPYDSFRVAMIPFTTEPCLLKRLKLDDLQTLQQLSWKEVKRKLIAYLPIVNPEDVERELLEMSMTVDDDVEAFAAKMIYLYKVACQNLDVIELDIPLQDILAFTMTSNMRQEMLRPYEDLIKRDHESAIRRLEKAFRNKTYKESVFLSTRLKAESLNIPDISGRYTLLSETQPNYNEREMSPGIDKHQILRSWNDWKCVKCENTNRATWFTCDHRRCDGQATDRQTPRNSWNCVPECGQTNLRLDHYCHSCLRPNTKITPDRLRELPTFLKQQPRNRQIWFSCTPVLEP